MIRCDLHACWYALLFAPADEALVLKHYPAAHYYFYYRHELKFGLMPGFELTKVFDAFPPHAEMTPSENRNCGNAELLAQTFHNQPQVCRTLEEVSDDVDLVFIADCLEEGKDHLALATPGLKKGVPTFVDKPFAYTLQDARAMVKLALENKTPLMSSSLLGQSPLIDRFHRRFEEIQPVCECFVKGVGPSLGSVIHGLSLAQHLFGPGVEWVDCMGQQAHEILRLHYPVKPEALPYGLNVVVLSGLIGPACGFQAVVYGYRTDSIVSPWINDFNFPLAGQVILKKCREMAQTRQPPLPYAQMLELINIVEAGRASRNDGKRVYLQDVKES